MERARLYRGFRTYLLALTATALLFAALSGCSTVRLSAEARRKIGSVSVSRQITEEGSYSGSMAGVDVDTRGAMWYSHPLTAPIGVICDLIYWSENKANRRRSFVGRMRGSRVRVGLIASNVFRERLRKEAIFDTVVDRGGDAEFRLSVEYGLSDGWGMRGTWKPWLTIEGVLVDREGGVCWKKSASISSDDARLPEFHEPFRRPGRLREAYTKAARILSAELLAHLRS